MNTTRRIDIHENEATQGPRARAFAEALRAEGCEPGRVVVSRVYFVQTTRSQKEVEIASRNLLADAVLETVGLPLAHSAWPSLVTVSPLGGVTDDEATVAQRELAWQFPELKSGATVVRTATVYAAEKMVEPHVLSRVTAAHFANPLVARIAVGHVDAEAPLSAPAPHTQNRMFDLSASDEELAALSQAHGWNFSMLEWNAIRQHAAGRELTECELEIIAQSWSEHCKHKEFNARIAMTHNGRSYEVNSLFKSFIRKSTEEIRAKYAARGEDWMLTVFSDNAGVVKLSDKHLFALKVETHNSPSALDPVGGAMTGLLGTHRDAIGTGIGGGRLLFNTNVLCFGPADYARELLPGQMHPSRIGAGVIDGIAQAGNKMGVPTINGAVIYDERYAGKPLVYCGTGALLPQSYAGRNSWDKTITPGDRIVVVGGRVGRDGIHGATFSSVELGAGISRSVVQMGSPITQKLVADFMEEACKLGLVACSTDNGAGGLSSSVGELAGLAGGARIDVAKVPLKYAGLEPWEILLSESQERMTLAVHPDKLAELAALAVRREVELTDIGVFEASGAFRVDCNELQIANLDLHFLHEGVPQKQMVAEWTDIAPTPLTARTTDHHAMLLKLLASPNIRSRERVSRRYDHEVKGKTVVKPYMGAGGKAPQDAGVMRLGFDTWEGIAVASGICPKYGDLEPYHMAAGAFDEAVRSLVSVGAVLPEPGAPSPWSACDNFCVPDSEYHPEKNPDGKQKLGKLVRMCEALYDMSVAFDVPMTSGKDSMKNDFRAGGVKISVPPTVLFTICAPIKDVRKVVTSEFKAAGDGIYALGATYNELGGTEWAQLAGACCGDVPRVRHDRAKELYGLYAAARMHGWIQSSHDMSDGGLAVASAECVIGSGLGASIEIEASSLVLDADLYAESHSRLLVSVKPEHQVGFEGLMGGLAQRRGVVRSDARLVLSSEPETVEWSVAELRAAYEGGTWP